MKKQQSYSLHIDSPCHEQWDAMLQVHNGKYCLHCAKTDANGKSSFCGRFRNEQLNRALVLPHQQRSSYFALPVLIAGALSLITPETASSQDNPLPMQTEQQDTSNTARTTTVTINGFIKDSSGKSISGAIIKVVGTTRGAISKSNGRFSIVGIQPGTYQLQISYVGYEKKLITINTQHLEFLTIQLHKSTNVSKPIEVITGKIRIDK